MSHRDRFLKDFKLPDIIKFEYEEVNSNYGRFIVAPFERGFGVTIANSLRRTLISSIQGYAITAIRMEYLNRDGTQVTLTNDFESIYGMYEETLDFIQNLKQVRLKLLDGSENRTIMVEKQGDYILKAKDLEVDSNIKVYNPDLYLATLNEDCDITLEIQIDFGRGYVHGNKNIEYANTIGAIPIDAIFSPIFKVNHTIENYRVGQRTDYDKVILEVWTDGSITPDDAVSNAARILREYYLHFTNFEEQVNLKEIPQIIEENEQDSIHLKNIDELELSVRSSNCLKADGIRTVGDLIERTEDDISKIKNLGKKSLSEIKEKLQEFDLALVESSVESTE